MLLGTSPQLTDLPSSVDTVHNYYENLVLNHIPEVSEKARTDLDFLADVACVALNRLPPRYIRYNVDMTFFMSPTEMREMHDKVSAAVHSALDYVMSRDSERNNLQSEE